MNGRLAVAGSSSPFTRNFLAGLAVSLLVFGGARRLNAAQTWMRISGPHFVLISDASEGATREVAAEVSGYEDVIGKFIHANPARLKPLTIVLFANDEELDPFKPRTPAGQNIDDTEQDRDGLTGSLITSGNEWTVIGAVRRINYADVTRGAVLSACAAWYMSALHIRAPAALRSGTSRMLGLFEEGSDYARFGRPNRLFLQILGRWELIPVEKLLLIRNQEEIVDAHLRMTFTAESWAFAHYLLFAQVPMKRHAFSTFWAASKEGLSPHEALVRALGPEGAAHIDASLQSYLHGISYTVSLPYDHSGRGLSPLGAADPAEVEVALAKVGCVAQPALGLAHAEAAIAVAHGPEAYEIRAEILVRTHAPASRIREAVDAALAQGSHAAWILTHDAEGKLSQAGGRQASPTQNRAAVNQA